MNPMASDPKSNRIEVGEAAAELDQRLSDELDRFNNAATAGLAPQRELTVQVHDAQDNLVAGLSGWTWGTSAGIAMVWVHENSRREGWGNRMLTAAETEARGRGCTQIFVSSFTFQSPAFYQRNGYLEYSRQANLPSAPHSDVHMRKAL
jgi:ribosomal protein S18 acetylase RimI-like enzyme